MNVGVICFANFCRSPVAEKILAQKFLNNITFQSFGIDPMVSGNMDIRSINFLKNKGINDYSHMPKKIYTSDIKRLDLLLCMDHQILSILNNTFPNHSRKYKIFSYVDTSIMIADPYRFDDKNYEAVMEKVCKASNLITEDNLKKLV